MSVDQTSFRKLLQTVQLDKMAAQQAQRIGTLPDGELQRALCKENRCRQRDGGDRKRANKVPLNLLAIF